MHQPLISLGLRFGSVWFARSVLGIGIIGTLIISIGVGMVISKLAGQ